MVQCCVKMQKERHAATILIFRGLQLYESTASGEYEHHVANEASRTERQFAEDLDTYWSIYRKKLVELFDTTVSADELVVLDREGREEIRQEKPNTPKYIQDALLRGRLSALKCQRMSALSEGDFRAHRSLRGLRDALIERHAIDFLAPSSEGTEEEGALPAA